MTEHKETTVNFNPSAYELGVMFYEQGRLYSPFTPGTEGDIQFREGRIDARIKQRQAEEALHLDYMLSLSAAGVYPVGKADYNRLRADAALARSQYHMA